MSDRAGVPAAELSDEDLEQHLESVSDPALGGALEDELVVALQSALQELPWHQRACWLLRSRPGGLADSLAEFSSLRHALLRAVS